MQNKNTKDECLENKSSKINKNIGNKGITLVALVITIIVLLILAGVSIAMLIGNNGILTQARKAKTTTEISTEKEKIELALIDYLIGNANKSKYDLIEKEVRIKNTK